MNDLMNEIKTILEKYFDSFRNKTYSSENEEVDILMRIYGITPEQKRENRQYWGRELGMMWQLLVEALCKEKCSDYKPALHIESDEPCDLRVGKDAIDTKYRIGSGDSGTLKKFKQYGKLLNEKGYRPVLLILRDDNLPAAITACRKGGWTIIQGEDDVFEYLQTIAGCDFRSVLESYIGCYVINLNSGNIVSAND